MAKKVEKVLPFLQSEGSGENTSDGKILDKGTIGKLKYEHYQRGVIHIHNGYLRFKKNCDDFEDELNQLNLKNLVEGEHLVISGSGDNDDLIFEKKDGEIVLELQRKEFGVIKTLRKVIKKAKDIKKGASNV